MSKKYLTGSKRLQIIQRWLNGVDDPEYDVFPTRKEGKYIVKPRNETIKQTTKEVNEEPTETTPEQEEPEQYDHYEGLRPGQSLEPKTTPKPKQITRPKARQQTNINDQSYHPTINIDELKYLEEEDLNDDQIIVNGKIMDKRSFKYSLRVYQTLTMSGNRDAMWNAHILMKAANIPNQLFTRFITESNETVFLHELDFIHRRQTIINETESINQPDEIINEKEEEINEEEEIKDNRSIRGFLYSLLSYADEFFFNLTKKLLIDDLDFYEEISDKDPYAAFTLAWTKREDLSAAFDLLDKTEKMKPESKVAVFISKMIIISLSFINSLFHKKIHVLTRTSQKNISNYSLNNSSENISSLNLINYQKIEYICNFIKSSSYIPDILLGFGILSALAFFIYVRITLYIE